MFGVVERYGQFILELDYNQLIKVWLKVHEWEIEGRSMKGNCRLVYCFNPIYRSSLPVLQLYLYDALCVAMNKFRST